MIAVIGATGFIGTYLVDKLKQDNKDVIACGTNKIALEYYKDKNIVYEKIDITQKDDFKLLDKYNIEAIVLLSALLPANVNKYSAEKYIDVNVNGTLNVLEYCRKSGINTILSTTSYADVQNNWSAEIPITELTPRSFNYNGDHAVYVFSKNMASDLIFNYYAEYGIRGIVFRLPPVYGVGPHSSIYVDGKKYKSGFQVFVDKALNKEDIEIFRDENAFRDVVYVKDVVSAIIKAIENKNAKGLYNIGSGIKLTLRQQVEDIIKVFAGENSGISIRVNLEKDNKIKSYVFDISKASNDFGYRPRYSNFEYLLNDYKKEMALNRFTYLTERGNNK